MAELYAGRPLTEQTSWSFLALMWGLVADVDLESEACRCFGAARFDVYSAVRAQTAALCCACAGASAFGCVVSLAAAALAASSGCVSACAASPDSVSLQTLYGA